MKDSVMKSIVFETSYIKNIEYDIENISEVFHHISFNTRNNKNYYFYIET